MWPLVLKFIGKQDSGEKCVKGITCYHCIPIIVTIQIFTFFIFFPLINEIFKTRANYKS